MRMRAKKQRCPQCGARNRERITCRICTFVLPVVDVTDGPAFVDLVENELRNWNALAADPVYVISEPPQVHAGALRDRV